jgi:EF-P beta-lysylation protein EpmB
VFRLGKICHQLINYLQKMRVLMSNWQQELSNGFGNVADLLEFLEIDISHGALEAQKQFKTKVPQGFAMRMQKKCLEDPLLKQVLASFDELIEDKLFVDDPLQEKQFNPVPGLIHKYPHRVLLVLSGACAVHCRYCFRRHFPYQENNPGKQGWQAIKDYLLENPQVSELIFSGGDPLILNNDYFQKFLTFIQDVPSIQTIRIHSRIPIVLPSRIEADWLKIWDAFPWKKVMVVHANHPQELDDSVHQSVQLLKKNDWLVLNQSVLLKDVNNDLEVLVFLSQKLFSMGILPYYLHLLDPVKGASHFQLEKQTALELYERLQAHLPGYLVPKLVQEIPGKLHKTLVK